MAVPWTLLNFENDWCAQCYTERPIVQAAVTAHPNLVLQTINVTQQPDLAATYQVRRAPTLILCQGQREVARNPGYLTAAQLTSWLAYYLPPEGNS